jgi:cytochrome c peroxidase
VALALSAGAALSQTPALAPLPDAPKINETRAELGALLFFDDRLSGDTAQACAACHDPARGWGTGEPMAPGYTGVLYFRNAPGLFNAGHRAFFMWDARLDGADPGTLVRDMITEAHTMNMDTRLAQERLKQVPEYVALFEKGFGGDPYGGKIYGAIAEFLKTIRTVNAPLDAHLRGGAPLAPEAERGKALFTGKAGCIACHSGPMLADGKVHATGVPDHPDLQTDAERQITMLRHLATMGVPNYMNQRRDPGHYVVTKDEADRGKFLTPSLWDAGQTAPYMHSGVFATLAEVVDFYDRGGGETPNKSPLLRPLGLTAAEKADLLAFLATMTGDAPSVVRPALPDYQTRTVGRN